MGAGSNAAGRALSEMYDRLHASFGPQRWWPAETPFEVIVGAILTQSVSWTNVAQAIANLKQAGLLDPRGLFVTPNEEIEPLVRPTGYYRQKVKKLKSFLEYFWGRHGGSLIRMFATPAGELRGELLAVWGLGRETVDSIMLYAGGLPTFVVDAYTVRVLSRLGLVPPDAAYEDVRALFMNNLPANPRMFNEYHALLVHLGKHYCTKRGPACGECPLR
ncbi:MAG: endonuclease III domain-containing protein [Firmicutes bacterium]|nr:endonuclease III domain-containing protein [Bacillota bacterium]